MNWSEVMERQLGGALKMLENAIVACPDSVWSDACRAPAQQFWYLAYHTLFFLDFYLAPSADDFVPPEPFTLSELDPAGVFPDRVYTQAELLEYLRHGRNKLTLLLSTATDETLSAPRRFSSIDGTVFEVLIYSLRHIQHHTAQLNLVLRQDTGQAPRWVATLSCR